MATKNNDQSGQDRTQNSQAERSVGNAQGTTQTGAQNAGGQNIEERVDQYTDDLRRSGDRASSNRNQKS